MIVRVEPVTVILVISLVVGSVVGVKKLSEGKPCYAGAEKQIKDTKITAGNYDSCETVEERILFFEGEINKAAEKI